MENLTFDQLINAGPIPLLGIIAWLLHKLNDKLTETSVTILAQKQSTDERLSAIHADNRAIIKKLAGFIEEIKE